MPTWSKISSDVRTGPIEKIGGFEICHASAVAGGRDSGVISNRVDASVLHQPSNRGRSRAAEVALVDERSGERARPRVEVLVRAPGGEVDVPVVQLQGARCRPRGRGPNRRPHRAA